MYNIIFDTDGGSDDALALMFMLSIPNVFNILGITTVHGNVSVERATHNIGSVLTKMGRTDIPVYKGAKTDLNNTQDLMDNAHGEDGMGGVVWDNDIKPQNVSAQEFLKTTIGNQKNITVIACGPMTNLAILAQDSPMIFEKIKKITALGGCKEARDVNDDIRHGNITPDAEFNAYKDPSAMARVVKSCKTFLVDLDLLPIDAIQGHDQQVDPGLVLTPERYDRLNGTDSELAQLANAAYDIDTSKWGAQGAFLFDVAVPAYLAFPQLFDTNNTSLISVDDQTGRTHIDDMGKASSWFSCVRSIKNVDTLFSNIADMIDVGLTQAPRRKFSGQSLTR